MAERLKATGTRPGVTAALLVAMLVAVLPLLPNQVEAKAATSGPVVVEATVIGEPTTVTTIGGMHLVTEFSVDRVVKGDAPDRLLVETPGGISPAGFRQVVSHQPSFSLNDRVRLRLSPTPRVEAGVIGAVVADDGEDLLSVYSVVGGIKGSEWLEGTAASQVDALTAQRAAASGDYRLHGAEWLSFPTTYRINPAGAPDGSISAIRNAATTWENVPGTDIGLTYTGTTTSTGAVGDYNNVISWITPTNPADTYLAQATWWITNNGDIVAFDIVFSENYDMTVGQVAGHFDVESIALHEFGHVLGLAHADAASEVMYPTIPSGTLAHTLGSGDIAGVASMYAASGPPEPTPTAVPPTATPVPPTATPVPTSTPVPPTATPVPPTATPVPPTATPVPPTATPVPTSTPVPPTATPVPPTATPVPTSTPIPTPTPPPVPTPMAASLAGRVTILETGIGLFGTRVCAERPMFETEHCALTNGLGQFLIDDLPTGNYTVFAQDPGKRYLPNCAGQLACTQPQIYGITTSAGASGLTIELDPIYNRTNPTPTPDYRVGEARITGTVTESGAPAAGVMVCAKGISIDVVTCATSGVDGHYSIDDLPTGNYRVEFDGGASCYRATSGCAGTIPVGVVSPMIRSGIDGSL